MLFFWSERSETVKKTLSLLLVLVSLFSCFAGTLSCFALSNIAVTTKAVGNQYKLTWNYDGGTTMFYVYVDGKKDGYKKPTSEHSYTFTTDPYEAGIKHTIVVKAYKGLKLIAQSESMNRYLPPLVPTLKCKCESDGYTLTPAVASGTVHDYSLYKYNGDTKKYEFYKNITKAIKIKTNTETYRDVYIAKAYVKYAKVYFSDYCEPVVCAPTLGAVTLKSAKSAKAGQVTLTWSAANYKGFTGYQIFYTSYDSFGKFRVAAAAKDKTSCTLQLIPGICYKFKVRTYRNTSAGKVYGTWSNVKTTYTVASVVAKPNVKDLLNNKVKVNSPGKTGNEKLNKVLDKILAKIGCGPKSTYKTYDKVRFAYRYIAAEQFKKDGDFGVKGSSDGGTYAENSTLRMIENKGTTGSCYEYNHLMHFLCKRMGLYNTYMVDGEVSAGGGGRTGHWWMMMKIAGNNYYFDPRMQRYLGATQVQFMCLPLNGSNTYSDYFRFYDAAAELK